MFAWWLALPVLARAQNDDDVGGFCPDGSCINCNYCDGSCFSTCSCNTELNTCCCQAPPGYYARGYEKIPCPGGTYQDSTGKTSCKLCSTDATELFDVNYRGAVDLVACEEAKCSSRCGNSTDCEVQCVSSVFVETAMMSHPENITFCSGLEQPVDPQGCSWQSTPSSAPGWHMEVFALTLWLALCCAQ
ncbi:unnamed protein product [Effrenium voratum]|uniref:Uncharacterized protein n=1 Tax=Effrenium voratum TaxID=2562239 RepID=A0AA36HQC0_9DINO|nr:unnamed protein product [Effrenium voratum]CAJ1373343.1 unnamed protein product [Effrenium voratum]CAJ1424787.1 unnamed protein product [Effrenium voratum]|mmetsp:Transcript_125286/g.297345  ORF Transcript_125286/g.297345 Transcript_125286/m.297345 type:complete len:189 (-) Transcript_125286:63-629(-)